MQPFDFITCLVWMEFERQLAIRALDFLLCGTRRHAENLKWIEGANLRHRKWIRHMGPYTWTFASWIVTHLLCREMHMRYQQCSDSPQRKHKEVVCRGNVRTRVC